MAENHRNQGSEPRYSSQEWDNDYNRQQRNWEERYQGQGMQENRDQGYSGNRYDRQNEEGNSGNRWNRDSGYRGSEQGGATRGNDYGSGMGGNYSSGNYGNQDRNYGYGGREYGSNYGGGGYQGNSSYWDSGAYGNSGRASYGKSRNLYDRDYEQFDRGFNSGYSGLGAANYGGSRQRDQRGYGESPFYGSTNPENYRGSGSGGNYGNRGYGRGDSNERSWWDRTRDEVSSWFGDEEAERRRDRDERQSHRGKGPKNYSRSDDRIKEDINDRLSDDPWVDASEIDVTVSTGEVTLTGTVNDRSDKRRAEDIAEAVSGVKQVENRIRVSRRESSYGTGSGSTGGSYASSETNSPQSATTGTTGSTGGTTGTSGGDKNKSKSSYVTG